MADVRKLAIYPFLTESKEFVRKMNITIDEILTDIVYEKTRLFGVERVMNALDKGDVGDRKLRSESDFISEILSHAVAKMIAVCVKDNFVIRRYALGEAVHAYRHLVNEDIDFILNVCRDLKLNVERYDGGVKIHFIDYLEYAPTSYQKWKLINRTLDRGFVHIENKNLRDLIRIVQEAVMKKIILDISDKVCIDTVEDVFRKEIERIREYLAKRKKRLSSRPVGKVNLADIPPCMKEILSMIQSGENVPHMGRFAIVAFFHALGISREEIFKLFSAAPDFDEERTRYQIDHITGRISSTEYSPPGCDKMRTYGLCPTEKMDDICRSVKHPISYYWKKVKK